MCFKMGGVRYHIPHTTVGLLFVTSLCLVVSTVSGQAAKRINNEATPPQGADSSSALPKKDTLEETVFAEMLRIVDQKFDSLSARITVMERSVSSLNFYSIRQFREITESIEESTAATEGLRSQVTKMDGDNRAIKLAVSQIGRDVIAVKTENSRMFDDIANSIVYFNQNVKENAKEVRSLVFLSSHESRDSSGIGPAQSMMIHWSFGSLIRHSVNEHKLSSSKFSPSFSFTDSCRLICNLLKRIPVDNTQRS